MYMKVQNTKSRTHRGRLFCSNFLGIDGGASRSRRTSQALAQSWIPLPGARIDQSWRSMAHSLTVDPFVGIGHDGRLGYSCPVRFPWFAHAATGRRKIFSTAIYLLTHPT